MLIDIVEQAAGGSPTQVPAAYDARSPLKFAAELTAWPGSLLIVHGVEDELVPPEQSCALIAASSGFEARHYDASATTPLATPPAGCEASGISWLTTPKPTPNWPGKRHALIYDAAKHSLDPAVPAEAAMIDDLPQSSCPAELRAPLPCTLPKHPAPCRARCRRLTQPR